MELKVQTEKSMPGLKAMGLKAQGFFKPTAIMDDQARQKILQVLEARRKAAWQSLAPKRKATALLLERRGVSPEDIATFLGSYPDLEGEEEGTPVKLVPKGGKK